ncbi:hypothetical protein CVT26_003133 [Gymnopilus dilepis]|uniref:Uncharacterized protein n=1 Tax=Gymnopilus dilepis TaxID=231916 RepID=A0A409Y4L7_9AGAR|nr:hypothetical protein CVT26_003133 [Gymnopilus dilepis]
MERRVLAPDPGYGGRPTGHLTQKTGPLRRKKEAFLHSSGTSQILLVFQPPSYYSTLVAVTLIVPTSKSLTGPDSPDVVTLDNSFFTMCRHWDKMLRSKGVFREFNGS